MTVKIIKIGNSKGIMLSKQLLNHYNLENEVELISDEEGILNKPRQDWEKQFQEAKLMGEEPERELLEGFENDFDKNEWKW